MPGLSSYMRHLEQKEARRICSFFSMELKHGHLSAISRVSKGLLFGFGMANFFVSASPTISLAFSVLLFALLASSSFLMIHYERRAYNRRGASFSIRVLLRILLASSVLSLIILLYSNLLGFLVSVSITMFFSSIAYSLE